jgi:hypothetical protein
VDAILRRRPSGEADIREAELDALANCSRPRRRGGRPWRGVVDRGSIWMADLGMAAKVRRASF